MLAVLKRDDSIPIIVIPCIGMFPLIHGDSSIPIIIPCEECEYKGKHPKALHSSWNGLSGPLRFEALVVSEGLGFRV